MALIKNCLDFFNKFLSLKFVVYYFPGYFFWISKYREIFSAIATTGACSANSIEFSANPCVWAVGPQQYPVHKQMARGFFIRSQTLFGCRRDNDPASIATSSPEWCRLRISTAKKQTLRQRKSAKTMASNCRCRHCCLARKARIIIPWLITPRSIWILRTDRIAIIRNEIKPIIKNP